MKNIQKYIVPLLVILTAIVPVFAQKTTSTTKDNSPTITCDDLLEHYGEKPKELEYLNCESLEESPIIHAATYRVSGKQSKKVERFLRRNYGMGKLVFNCCGWEPENGKHGDIPSETLKKINPDYHLMVTMFATTENQENKEGFNSKKERKKVAYFYVTVNVIEI